jgi:hypothetical protein
MKPAKEEKPIWTDWERIKFAQNWRALMKAVVRGCYERGEMRGDRALQRWAGFVAKNGDAR